MADQARHPVKDIIKIDGNCVTVITRAKIRPSALEEFLALSKRSVPTMKKQPGFIGLAFHLSEDKTEAVTYLQWKSVLDHENCMSSPDWASDMPLWERMLNHGDVDFSVHLFDIVDTAAA